MNDENRINQLENIREISRENDQANSTHQRLIKELNLKSGIMEVP